MVFRILEKRRKRQIHLKIESRTTFNRKLKFLGKQLEHDTSYHLPEKKNKIQKYKITQVSLL